MITHDTIQPWWETANVTNVSFYLNANCLLRHYCDEVSLPCKYQQERNEL